MWEQLFQEWFSLRDIKIQIYRPTKKVSFVNAEEAIAEMCLFYFRSSCKNNVTRLNESAMHEMIAHIDRE